MPILSADTSSLTFSEANQEWIVRQGVLVAATADNANAVSLGRDGGRLFNHGQISATGGGASTPQGVHITGDDAFVFNAEGASIVGRIGIGTQGRDTEIFNGGTIVGLTGSGVLFDGFGAELHNDGYIFGETAALASIASGPLKIANSGTLESDGIALDLRLSGADGPSRIANSGTIDGEQQAIRASSSGVVVLRNSGDITGTVVLDAREARVVNEGLISGDLVLSGGADTFRAGRGIVSGVVSGGNGKDNLKGGIGDDELSGEGSEDDLAGRGGDDVLDGGKFADRLDGGAGEDILYGGERGDKLIGGSGGDSFLYKTVLDSTRGDASRDTILDFHHGDGDRIDFSAIDARKSGGDSKFDFIGTTAFSKTAGQLRLELHGNDVLVQGDVNGNGRPDIEIKVNDVSSLVAGDFIL